MIIIINRSFKVVKTNLYGLTGRANRQTNLLKLLTGASKYILTNG